MVQEYAALVKPNSDEVAAIAPDHARFAALQRRSIGPALAGAGPLEAEAAASHPPAAISASPPENGSHAAVAAEIECRPLPPHGCQVHAAADQFGAESRTRKRGASGQQQNAECRQ